jgi:hypothetical protein
MMPACFSLEVALTQAFQEIFPHISPKAVELPIEGSALDRIRQKCAKQEMREQRQD